MIKATLSFSALSVGGLWNSQTVCALPQPCTSPFFFFFFSPHLSLSHLPDSPSQCVSTVTDGKQVLFGSVFLFMFGSKVEGCGMDLTAKLSLEQISALFVISFIGSRLNHESMFIILSINAPVIFKRMPAWCTSAYPRMIYVIYVVIEECNVYVCQSSSKTKTYVINWRIVSEPSLCFIRQQLQNVWHSLFKACVS